MRILDLGVGSGYLSFPIAKLFPTCQIVGLDIVEKALQTNQKRAEEEQLNNISFVNYDGMNFPFENNSFDLVITRYALHHFPNIKFSLSEVKRVLKPEGHFFLSDPRPNDCDNTRFVDEYMQLKKDGHIKFYTKQEWIQLYAPIKTSFDSSIRFPKKKDTAYGYEDVLKRHDSSIIQSYELEETETEIYVTEQVNNILFFSEIESKIIELETNFFLQKYMNNEAYLQNIIDDSYLEFGKSKNFYTKGQVISALLSQKDNRDIQIENFSCQQIDCHTFLVHYYTNSKQDFRTSIWQNKEGMWTILYHQAS